jgi:hypothetical protein
MFLIFCIKKYYFQIKKKNTLEGKWNRHFAHVYTGLLKTIFVFMF